MLRQLARKVLHALDERRRAIERILAQTRHGGMTAFPLEDGADLDPATMPTINVHARGLADDHKIGANAFVLHQGMWRDAVAPLLHIAEVIERPTVQQSELFQR